ncbi:MAG: DUF5317 domain-containing protein [Clostridiaceae bacterium]|nr:DUF5317 domain-containing protein [Clostridiaceae bacterium]
MLYIVVMFFALLIGIFITHINGRKPSFSNIKFEKSWLLLIAVALQILSSIAEVREYKFATSIAWMVNGTIFCLAFLVIWFNREYFGLWFIGLGAFLNALVMLLNGGRMPVDMSLLGNEAYMAKALDLMQRGADSKHVALDEATRIPILADIISLPGFLGLGMPVISIGDIIVAVGVFLLCLQFVIKPRKIDV